MLEDDHVSHWDFRDAQPGDEAIRAKKIDANMRSGSSAPGAISFEGHRRQIQDLIDAVRKTGLSRSTATKRGKPSRSSGRCMLPPSAARR